MTADRYAVLGRPISHSLSPAMQGAAFQAAGIDATYEAIEVSPERLGEVVDVLRVGYQGFNVTVPHKGAMVALVDELDPLAADTGAVNTVSVRNGRTAGYNTDVEGFRASIAPYSLSSAPAVVFGTGGAARAVSRALRELSILYVAVSRTPRGDILGYDSPELTAYVASASLVVNATPLGMAYLPDGSPLPAGVGLSRQTLVVDLVYGRDTPFLRTARVRGCRCQDGREMLVQQGAAAFRIWTGIDPDVGAMRAALNERLGGRV